MNKMTKVAIIYDIIYIHTYMAPYKFLFGATNKNVNKHDQLGTFR